MAKRRFWNAEVLISQKMYENSHTAMYILRLLGIFPLGIKRKALGIFLKFNPLYALYSWLLGAVTLSAIYYRIYEELISDTKSSQNVKTVDRFVRFTAINAFCLIAFYEIFIMPTKLMEFFKYIKYIRQVDNNINMTFSKSNRYKSIFMLTMPLLYNVTTDILDFYTHYKIFKAPWFGTLRQNIGYYTIYIMAFAVICINRYMGNCLEIRVVKMNKILNGEYLTIRDGEKCVSHTTSAVSKASQITETEISLVSESPNASLSSKASVAITKVTEAYLKWMKAAEMVSNLFGIIITVGMVAILCQLVASKFFIILALEGRSRDIFELIDWTLVFSVQIMRILLIIEPWHSCMVQLEILKRNVCNLLSLNLDRSCREKIDSFAMILSLRQYSFSACGLFIVDRLLYTTVIDTVVTFLVISLQAEEQDRN